MSAELSERKPILKFDDEELYFDVDFPGYPAGSSGHQPAAGAGIRRDVPEFVGRALRMKDYDGG